MGGERSIYILRFESKGFKMTGYLALEGLVL